MMIGFGTPTAIGWLGVTVHTSYRSASLRQISVPPVPTIRVKLFDACPECITSKPIPARTCLRTLDNLVGNLLMRTMTPPRQDVRLRDTSSLRPWSGSASVAI